MEIVWSPQALGDIEAIGDFIAEDSPVRANSFVEELVASVEHLGDFPELGSIVEDNPVFRQLIHEGYGLIYQLRVDKILIITVLGPRQSINKI